MLFFFIPEFEREAKIRKIVIYCWKLCIDQLNKCNRWLRQHKQLEFFTGEIGIKVVRNKKLKISIPDNIFILYLIIIKLCTLKQLENIHQKLKLIFS